MNERVQMISSRLRRQRGVSIIEALVALVVISVGMLGIAGLYLSSLQASRSAKLRAQAVTLVASIADRVRANRDAASAYDTDTYAGAPAVQACEAATCSAGDMAQDDLARWIDEIGDHLPGATGTVQVTDRNRPQVDNFVIQITWREPNADSDYSYALSMDMSNRL